MLRLQDLHWILRLYGDIGFMLGLLLCVQARAGAPLRINFQGRLEESGQAAAGAKTFVFKIYDAVSGGTPVWTSQPQSATLTNGVFSVILETGAPANANLSTATFSGSRFVAISVNGTDLSPRQEIVSAPYSLVSQSLSSDARISLSNLADILI